MAIYKYWASKKYRLYNYAAEQPRGVKISINSNSCRFSFITYKYMYT